MIFLFIILFLKIKREFQSKERLISKRNFCLSGSPHNAILPENAEASKLCS
jgi:hypothetical protein